MVDYLLGLGPCISLRSSTEQIPLRKESVDVVILLNVIDHCLYPQKTIEELYRIMKPGGVAYSQCGCIFKNY